MQTTCQLFRLIPISRNQLRSVETIVLKLVVRKGRNSEYGGLRTSRLCIVLHLHVCFRVHMYGRSCVWTLELLQRNFTRSTHLKGTETFYKLRSFHMWFLYFVTSSWWEVKL
jgi:hypothetical protein